MAMLRSTVLLSLQFLIMFAGGVLAAQETAPAIQFRYKFFPGQQYRIISQVDQKVYKNRRLSYGTQILNRIAVKVLGVEGDTADLDTNFQISEQSEEGDYFSWADEYQVRFQMDERGLYSGLGPQQSVPSLRSVPHFPAEAIEVGHGWSSQAQSVDDLQLIFGIPQVLKYEFDVHYLYRGKVLFEGRSVDHFTLFYKYDKDLSSYWIGRSNNELLPTEVKAEHNSELYWDSDLGLPVYESADYQVLYRLSDGTSYNFVGRSRGRMLEASPLPREETRRDIQQELEGAGIDAQLSDDEKGVTISLDDILFYPNSSRMLPGQDPKLDKIASVLQRFPDRDIMISGHTADVGRPEEQFELSEKRAAAVAEYFLKKGVRRQDQMVVRGAGASMPVAPNNTPEGQRQNRRVEITILEN